MSRELVLVVRCDHCSQEIEEGTGNALYLSEAADKLPSLTVDLCADHVSAISWLFEVSHPVSKVNPERPPLTERGREAIDCPFCGERFTIGSGIAIHVKSKHPQYYRAKTNWSMVTFDGKQMVG